MRRRLMTLAAAVALAVAAIPGVAAATPKNDSGDHKVTICHVTNSAKNPYVVITVDVAAFDGEGKSDHMHHVSKDGKWDVEFSDGGCVVPDLLDED